MIEKEIQITNLENINRSLSLSIKELEQQTNQFRIEVHHLKEIAVQSEIELMEKLEEFNEKQKADQEKYTLLESKIELLEKDKWEKEKTIKQFQSKNQELEEQQPIELAKIHQSYHKKLQDEKEKLNKQKIKVNTLRNEIKENHIKKVSKTNNNNTSTINANRIEINSLNTDIIKLEEQNSMQKMVIQSLCEQKSELKKSLNNLKQLLSAVLLRLKDKKIEILDEDQQDKPMLLNQSYSQFHTILLDHFTMLSSCISIQNEFNTQKQRLFRAKIEIDLLHKRLSTLTSHSEETIKEEVEIKQQIEYKEVIQNHNVELITDENMKLKKMEQKQRNLLEFIKNDLINLIPLSISPLCDTPLLTFSLIYKELS